MQMKSFLLLVNLSVLINFLIFCFLYTCNILIVLIVLIIKVTRYFHGCVTENNY